MSGTIELHLTYNSGTPKETRVTVHVSQERAHKIRALKRKKTMTITEAYNQTEDILVDLLPH